MTRPVFVEEKPMEGREVEAAPGAVIGREGTDIVAADPEVSRRHAAIREHGDGIAIEDLGSTNGTYVNDKKVQGVQPLGDGDVVRVGNTVWRLRVPTAADSDGTRVGNQQVAAPQVTAARSIPTEAQPPAPAPQPTSAQPVPSAASPAAPAAPSPAQVGPRGDVPAPPEVVPSAVRRVLPPPTQGQAPPFQPTGAHKITSRRGSAAQQIEWTIVCMLIVIAVAVAITVYFASQ